LQRDAVERLHFHLDRFRQVEIEQESPQRGFDFRVDRRGDALTGERPCCGADRATDHRADRAAGRSDRCPCRRAAGRADAGADLL
jgi:hypothetical protein